MTAAEVAELRKRAQWVLRRPVPRIVMDGSAQVAAQFRDDAADVAKVASGVVHPGWRQLAALQRLEGLS